MNERERALHHAALLAKVVDRVAYLRKYGSYSDRNPALGKMIRCPFCRARRRDRDKCCNTTYKVENKGTPQVKGRKNPRLTRKRPPLFLVHQLLIDIENDRRPDLENVYKYHLPAYVEKVLTDESKEKKRRVRNQQKLSRKRNR